MSARQAAAALTIANYAGGTVGSSATLLFNAYPYKGRAVCLATLAYGAFAAAIGVSPLLPVGMAAVCLCGAFDAVGCAASGPNPPPPLQPRIDARGAATPASNEVGGCPA